MPLLRFKETYTPSFPEAIPGDIDTFLQQTPPLKRFTKVTGQSSPFFPKT